MANELLNEAIWQKWAAVALKSKPDPEAERGVARLLHSAATEAYKRDPGGWEPRHHPGDFGLHAWGAAATKMSPDDIRSAIPSFASQREAADVLGVSQATISRAARNYSNVWDEECHVGWMLIAFLHAASELPCTISHYEETVQRRWFDVDGAQDLEQDHSLAWARHQVRSAIALGILCRGSDGLIHLGSGEPLGDARDELTYKRAGKVAKLCPKDPKHGATLERYCPRCRARIERAA